MKTSHKVKITLILVLLCLIIQNVPESYSLTNISGKVVDEKGNPIKGAKVAPLTGIVIGKAVLTRLDGTFNIDVESGISTLIIIADDDSTPGYDYIPSKIKISDIPENNFTINLIPAYTIVTKGNIQFVDTENLPTSTTYNVVDDKNEILSLSGFTLSFSNKGSTIIQIPGLEPGSIIMPLNYSKIMTVSFVLISNRVENKTSFIELEELGEKGEEIEIDLTKNSILYNFAFVESYLDNLKNNLNKMEGLGFYLAKEKRDIITATTQIEEANNAFKEEDLETSFDSLKKGFIILRQVSQTLDSLNLDALSSVYIILGFLALSSVVSGFLLAENKVPSVMLSLMFFTSISYLIYNVYPGSIIIPYFDYILTCIISISIFIFIALTISKIFGKTYDREKVGLSKVIVPIFSIAKRTLRRRRTRFLFTLISITLLVMSFVTLTSLSEEYGLISSVNLRNPAPGNGVILRSGSWLETSPNFLLLNEVEFNWLQNQQSVDAVSVKYSSQLPRRPIFTIYNQGSSISVMGLISINSTSESKITNFENVLIEGKLPQYGEIAIPYSMKEALNLELNEKISILSTEFKISGIIDNNEFTNLKEYDGRSYLPNKLENVNPPGEAPLYQQVVCEASEVVIFDYSSAPKLSGIGIIRITLSVKQGTDIEAFAEKLALERGYQAWSASSSGSTLYRLGIYMEGKGLPLIIPWAIVVLNVVVTMLNSLFERRREINILSSVGLNPAQIASIFVAEASITGFIAGGVGYIMGLSLYKIMPILGISLEVHQKISAFWSLASIGIAISAVLVGAFAALQSSIVITPSLTRKWKIDQKTNMNEPFDIPIPVKFEKQLLDDFIEFILRNLRNKENDPVTRTSSVTLESDGDKRIITFVYKSTVMSAGNFYTKNTMIIEPDNFGEYGVKFYSIADSQYAHETGSMIRQVIMAWSNRPKNNNKSNY
ncbi:hypothetical protein JW865_07585 [Candidatus Bathyarchaeota archaeon]|nr:hypothetical protein [Candidatus Bathyarchaeota archaeon]